MKCHERVIVGVPKPPYLCSVESSHCEISENNIVLIKGKKEISV
jgi:hypothetical protein